MLIQLQQVGKTYHTGAVAVRALHGVDLAIERGEFVAILGQSGSGKTTLLDILGCLSRPTEGEYRLDERPVGSLSDPELASIRNRRIGFIFQSFHLLPRKTALHNVELPLQYAGVTAEERRRRALETLRMVGLEDRVDHFPNQLSGGQQQRVAIARALVNQPSLLLADEPTGSLDSRSGQEILDLLHTLHGQGQTILLVTHARELTTRAGRVVTLHDGQIISDERADEQGPHAGTAGLALPYESVAGSQRER
ncbi:MAG: ABC transporter ATP-binding protein [Nitrospirae bacterium]|nr:ABC transporter ATP-binding protein [Nitrospirota bacterium]